jgi:hypothetical protein
MIVQEPPRKIKLELFSNEIEQIIEELERVPYNLYVYFGYGSLIKKLKSLR